MNEKLKKKEDTSNLDEPNDIEVDISSKVFFFGLHSMISNW
jgi:hypothetical protein